MTDEQNLADKIERLDAQFLAVIEHCQAAGVADSPTGDAIMAAVRRVKEANQELAEWARAHWTEILAALRLAEVPADAAGLVEQLKATKPESDGPNGVWEVLRNPDGPEAADTLTTLSRRIAELEGLLRGMLNIAECWATIDGGKNIDLAHSDAVKAARAALQEKNDG